MIGKIKKGSGFKGCVNYVLGKEQAALLHAEGVLAEYIVHTAFKSASLFYFSNHPITGL